MSAYENENDRMRASLYRLREEIRKTALLYEGEAARAKTAGMMQKLRAKAMGYWGSLQLIDDTFGEADA